MFKRTSPSVTHVHNIALGLNPLTMNMSEMPQGAGSGFVWDRDGHIVTNYHVIRGAGKVSVTLHDNRSYEAEVRGTCPEKDLAVLKYVAAGVG